MEVTLQRKELLLITRLKMNSPEAEVLGVLSIKYLPQIAQIHTDKFEIICAICGKKITTTNCLRTTS